MSRAAFGNDTLDGTRRHRDDRQVGRCRCVADTCIRVDSPDRFGVWVDRQHGAGEPSSHEVVHEFEADGARCTAGADDRNRRGAEDPPDRRDDRTALAVLDVLVEIIRRSQGEGDVDEAVIKVTADGKSGVAEHVHHCPVLWQRFRVEAVDAVASCYCGEVFEHHGRQSSALLAVLDDECDLCPRVVRATPVVSNDRDDQSVELGHQSEPVSVVHFHQVMELTLLNLGDR